MKKILCVILTVVLFSSMALTTFAAFYDFDSSHWAFSYVDKLVKDGTINGFEDGTFRPSGKVTRAEFVKMIGKGNEVTNTTYADVPTDHWAYAYIMSSGLDPLDGEFFGPSVPITRGDVANLLWKRAGAPKDASAPPVISSQGSNADAVAWVYTNSIMTGDDNINLRLNDTLTRAEAAALIVRSREVNAQTKKTHFYDSVDPKVLETAFEAFGFIDAPYSENATITNGELAMAVARIISGHDKPDYTGVSATATFEHKYAKPLNMLCRYYLGEEKDNAEYADKTATVEDTVMALMFATQRTSHKPLTYDVNGASYPAVIGANEKCDKLLKCAYQNGICLSDNMSQTMQNAITHKEFANLIIQFDGFSGFVTFKATGTNAYPKDFKIDTNISAYPANSDDFRIILNDIPKAVYEKPFVNMTALNVDAYDVTDIFDGIFDLMFDKIYIDCLNRGIEISILSSSHLSAQTGDGYVFRVNLKIVNKGNAKVLSDIIKCSDAAIGSKTISDGEQIWLDINTGTPLDKVDIPLDGVYVSQLV